MSIKVWNFEDLDNIRCIKTLNGHNSSVTGVKWHNDNRIYQKKNKKIKNKK